MRLLSAIVFSASAAMAPYACFASIAAADDDWNGAIAVSPSTGAIGTISGPATRKFEEQIAKEMCARGGASDCQVVTSFSNTCATVVQGTKEEEAQFFAELGEDEDTEPRTERVLKACREGAKECRIVTTFCAAFEPQNGI